jgi:TonB family protein
MKFLLIEYEPRYLDRIRGFLAGKDHDLVIAKDGEEGLEAYRRSKPNLVLISSVLPKLRTPDVIKGMQAMGPTPPILLMMSGYKGRNKRADAQRVGATTILEKPFTEETFLEEVATALGERPPREGTGGGSSEPAGPLLSADDIFSDILSGIDEPPKKQPPASDPLLQRRLEKTLSDILSGTPKNAEPGTAPMAAVPKGDSPPPTAEPSVDRTAGTTRVNVDQVMASLGASLMADSAPPKPPEKKKISAVDKLLTDTLSGLRPLRAPSEKFSPLPASRPPGFDSGATARSAARPAAVPTPHPAGPGAFGRYQLLEKIAAGGMAEVWKARMRGEEGFEKIVAIKRILPHMAMDEGFITMFVDEAKLAAQLTHNNITHIYDLGKVDAYHYIAMEYVDGKDLRSILQLARERDHPLPAELALFIASKIANALEYAHRRLASDGSEMNLVHRDVSPQNILISYEGDIKLCDFGIAKATTKASTTQSGALKGKLQYMSPEQAWGRKIDRRSDIFSLGVVLYEMLTGERLFGGDTDMTILEQVRNAKINPPSARNPEISRRIDQIVLKALAQNAADRYQSAAEFEKDVHGILFSYQPSPGPADVAIYLHRLMEAPSAANRDDLDAAFASSEAPEPAKKGRGLVISKQSSPPQGLPRPVPPPQPSRPDPPRPVASAVEAPRPALAAGESRKSRTGLVVSVGVAAVALVGVGLFVTRNQWSGGSSLKPAETVPAAKSATTSAAGTAAPPAAAMAVEPTAEPVRIVDSKAVEAEAKRLASEREKALREASRQASSTSPPPAKKPAAEAPATGSAPISLAASRPLEPPKPPERGPVEVAADAAPRATAPEEARPMGEVASPSASDAPVKEGDLVGPGEGVVEPKLVGLGTFTGLPPQARQIARTSRDGIGTPLVMALVDEKGVVTQTRVLRPSAYKFVDDAAVRALKGAKIEAATKNGVRVKMWKTFAITVKP